MLLGSVIRPASPVTFLIFAKYAAAYSWMSRGCIKHNCKHPAKNAVEGPSQVYHRDLEHEWCGSTGTGTQANVLFVVESAFASIDFAHRLRHTWSRSTSLVKSLSRVANPSGIVKSFLYLESIVQRPGFQLPNSRARVRTSINETLM
jgi:hypothetical protein